MTRQHLSKVTILSELLFLAVALSTCFHTVLGYQQPSTPVQVEIQRQRQRLSSSDLEERRDALMRLGAMRRADASREAQVGLSDASPMVRAVAAKSILSLGSEESFALLMPLVIDKDEFVRREVAYALGLTKNRKATEPLVGLLMNDKEDGVRAAAAVGLGHLGDEAAVVSLSTVLAPELQQLKKNKIEKNVFVQRAAAMSLGQIRSRAGVPALIAALGNDKLVDDVRQGMQP